MAKLNRLRVVASVNSGEALGILTPVNAEDENTAPIKDEADGPNETPLIVPAGLNKMRSGAKGGRHSGAIQEDEGEEAEDAAFPTNEDGMEDDEESPSKPGASSLTQGAAFRMPDELAFGTQQFLDAPELEELALKLIYEEGGDFDHLRDVAIGYLWKLKGGATGGKLVLGKTMSVPPLAQYYAAEAGSEVEYVITFSYDNLRTARFTKWQLEALMYHELCHLGWDDEKEKVKMVAHDFTVFNKELQRYGAWDYDINTMIRSARGLRPEQLAFDLE